jgi:hypothetical protein
MHMTFENITEPAEHPAYRAANLIRELHAETIAKIDGGFVFLQDGVDCSADMRAKCTVQIALCEQIMARAKDMAPMHTASAGAILDELEAIRNEAAKSEDGLATIPEIGNYDHGK